MMQTGFLLAHRDVACQNLPRCSCGLCFLPNLRTVKIFQGKRQVKNRRRGTGGEGAAVHRLENEHCSKGKNEKKTMKTKLKQIISIENSLFMEFDFFLPFEILSDCFYEPLLDL